MNYLTTDTSADYYNESKKLSDLIDTKYYDKIMTKLHLKIREEYQRTKRCSQKQKIEEEEEQEELHDQTRRSKRILVVDDEHDICMVYQIVLQDAGYECISYIDPVKALKEFRPTYYDLVILDIKMPVLNGFELCKKIIELDKTVHIIFITALEEYYEQFRSQHFPELGKINYIQNQLERRVSTYSKYANSEFNNC
jgi:PleD family two-component response regulator